MDYQFGARGLMMTEEAMYAFIENIGRAETFDELEDVFSDRSVFVRPNCPHPYPRYLKAVRVSLVELGYDEKWVDTVFRDALEERYMGPYPYRKRTK